MQLTIDEKEATKVISSPSWKDLQVAISNIDGNVSSFVILEHHDTGNYIQCAGNKVGLSVEFRQHSQNAFKHFRLGKRKAESPLQNQWLALECKVGPIMILKSELLTTEDVMAIFSEYFQTQKVLEAYSRRNITKQFLQNLDR